LEEALEDAMAERDTALRALEAQCLTSIRRAETKPLQYFVSAVGLRLAFISTLIRPLVSLDSYS
jgi:hypothetical protein